MKNKKPKPHAFKLGVVKSNDEKGSDVVILMHRKTGNIYEMVKQYGNVVYIYRPKHRNAMRIETLHERFLILGWL